MLRTKKQRCSADDFASIHYLKSYVACSQRMLRLERKYSPKLNTPRKISSKKIRHEAAFVVTPYFCVADDELVVNCWKSTDLGREKRLSKFSKARFGGKFLKFCKSNTKFVICSPKIGGSYKISLVTVFFLFTVVAAFDLGVCFSPQYTVC